MTQGVRAGHADLRKIQRKFRKGYYLASSGSNHFIVMGPDGPVRRNDGSGRHLGVPSSPRASSIWYHIQRLRDHGVLEQQGEERAVRSHEALVRDDLAALGAILPPSANNNEATNQLLEDLVQVKIHKPRNLKEYAEMTDVLSHVSGEPASEVHNSAMRLYNGMVLTEEEREPFVQLIGILETEEDPIRLRFGLLRQARGLPPHEEDVVEEQLQEETVSTPQEMLAKVASTGFSIEQLVGNFISDLREQVSQKLDEINKIEDLIKTMEEQYPSIQIEAAPTPVNEPPQRAQRQENGGGSRTVRVNPQQQREEAPKRPRHGSGGKFDPEEAFKFLAQGGEWTLKELSEATGRTDPTISRAVNKLIEEGRVVVVTPSQMGYGGRQPGTYGSVEFYPKQV